jgi:DNA topoisomerase-2
MLDLMQFDLDKLTNQARFVKMIIDGKLVVSKKKKAVLVQELRTLKFKPYPKKVDAQKGGEKEELAADPDASEEESQEGGAGDFDYLLGMAIWSLTDERVAKLLRQMGDKEAEIDTLIKLSPKDLWNKDLDDFINEWHTQLEDEKHRAKESRRAGRRASSKLGLAGTKPGKRKRKGGDDSDDDDDFTVGKKKKPTVKSVIDRVKDNKSSTLMNFFSRPESSVEPKNEDNDAMDIDQIEDDANAGAEPKLVAVKKRGPKVAAPKSKITVAKPVSAAKNNDDFDDVDDVFAAVAAQAKTRPTAELPARRRAAAQKAKYVASDSDSDNSDGDDMLGDVSMMVKGIGSAEDSGSKSRSLFANTAARPSSSHGLPKSIQKPKAIVDLDSDGIDETDYKSLIPNGSPVRPAARRPSDIGDDDSLGDSFDMPPPKPKIITKKTNGISKPLAKTKPVAKPAAKPVPKAALVPKKVVALSPAAKAYAAKQAARGLGTSQTAASKAPEKKAKKAVESDSEEELADEILSDEDEDESIVPVARARPGRAAAADAKKKAAQYLFDDDEDEEDEEEESFAVEDDSD